MRCPIFDIIKISLMPFLNIVITCFFLSNLQPVPQTYTYSVGYIYLDGSKLDMAKIDELRREIITQYNQGEPFKNLAAKYNMDGNLKPEQFEFVEEDVVPEFSQAVKNHKVGDIFTVDVPYNKWYYVVLRNPDSN